jgi:hypothetical protein
VFDRVLGAALPIRGDERIDDVGVLDDLEVARVISLGVDPARATARWKARQVFRNFESSRMSG